jgi:ABC-type Na+ efflux pump permease subunit
MNQKIEQYLNNLVDECIKSSIFSSMSEQQKKDNREKIADFFNQTVMDTLLSFMSKDELDKLEDINFESDEGVNKFAEVAALLPGYVFIEVGDRLRFEAESIKKSGQIPQ